MLDTVKQECPYCGERVELVIDASAGEQRYIEDCSVCCRPIEIELSFFGDAPQVTLYRDDES